MYPQPGCAKDNLSKGQNIGVGSVNMGFLFMGTRLLQVNISDIGRPDNLGALDNLSIHRDIFSLRVVCVHLGYQVLPHQV